VRHLLAFLALLACAAPASAVADDAVRAADRLMGTMAVDQPGAVVLVTRGTENLYSKAFGAADLEQGTPITPETRFHVASVSKQFTALAVALLAREGRLRLDEDIRVYLPELPDFGTRIRVVDLLHHTSGLRDQWDLFSLSGTQIQSLLTQQAILSLVRAQRELNFPPGTEYRYSNTGYSLAAEIVARVSGMPFRRFVEERIFTPLGMRNSLIYDDAAQIVPRRAQSYALTRAGRLELRRLNFSNYGATSMMTTAADLQIWSRELIEPQVFAPDLIRSLHAPTRLADGTASNYGLGLYTAVVRGRTAVMHSGSDAGFRAVVASFPVDRMSIVIVSNGSADMIPLYEGLTEIFVPGATVAAREVTPDPLRLARMAGYYASSWGSGLELRIDNGRLFRGTSASANPATFRADGTIEFSAPLTRFRLVEAAGGDVAGLEEMPVAGPPVRYDRVERQSPSQADLQALAGRYRSAELDITYTLGLADGRLTLSSLQSPEPVPLTPVGRDWFDMPFGRLLVQRAIDGRPDGLRVTSGRSRNLRFDRVD